MLYQQEKSQQNQTGLAALCAIDCTPQFSNNFLRILWLVFFQSQNPERKAGYNVHQTNINNSWSTNWTNDNECICTLMSLGNAAISIFGFYVTRTACRSAARVLLHMQDVHYLSMRLRFVSRFILMRVFGGFFHSKMKAEQSDSLWSNRLGRKQLLMRWNWKTDEKDPTVWQRSTKCKWTAESQNYISSLTCFLFDSRSQIWEK